MAYENLFSHIVFCACLTLIATAATKLMQKVRILDIPNTRSSHKTPTPKSGGVAVVLTFMLGATATYALADSFTITPQMYASLVLPCVLVACVSLYDDIKQRTYQIKLFGQLAAVTLAALTGLLIDKISIPFVGNVALGIWAYPATIFWLLALTNTYNFMDGIDGLAAGTAVIASAFLCGIFYSQGSIFAYVICYSILAGALGFLFFNFPPASIFLGDVGSAFLGLAFGLLAVISSIYDQAHTSFFVVPLILFNLIYDTAFTFIRRLIAGHNVLQPHCTHLYQLLVQLGWSHKKVALFHYTITITQGLAALSMLKTQGEGRLIYFLPFLAFQVLYSTVVMHFARKRGLL